MKTKNEDQGVLPEVFYVSEKKVEAVLEVLSEVATDINKILQMSRDLDIGELTQDEVYTLYHRGPGLLVEKYQRKADDELKKFRDTFKCLQINAETKSSYEVTSQFQPKIDSLHRMFFMGYNKHHIPANDLDLRIEWISIVNGQALITDEGKQKIREHFTYAFKTDRERETLECVHRFAKAWNDLQAMIGEEQMSSEKVSGSMDAILETQGNNEKAANLEYFARTILPKISE